MTSSGEGRTARPCRLPGRAVGPAKSAGRGEMGCQCQRGASSESAARGAATAAAGLAGALALLSAAGAHGGRGWPPASGEASRGAGSSAECSWDGGEDAEPGAAPCAACSELGALSTAAFVAAMTAVSVAVAVGAIRGASTAIAAESSALVMT
jgi:ribonuclease E